MRLGQNEKGVGSLCPCPLASTYNDYYLYSYISGVSNRPNLSKKPEMDDDGNDISTLYHCDSSYICSSVEAFNEETFGSSECGSIETLPSFFGTLPINREVSALDQLTRINASENDELMVSVLDV